jgi:lipopolysaccharide transport system ATP-binding protein
MDWAIKTEGLGKEYLIRHQQGPRYVALRDVLSDSVRRIFRRASAEERTPAQVTREHFWALKDVSFEMGQGERVGIIGRNGAGKSTLLKILSRVTDPSRGRAIIRGRVASLLEVGTGFHPELTGRENIFLNGAILGMTNAEIRRKFDEIVAFSEIEKFLDTPVKRYSSGMYVRLAFSVAAHLESEILVVDEVLAVGDTAFQKKCLAKMEEIGRSGKTILFVSHNMGTIAALCDRCMLLSSGKLQKIGPTLEVISEYNRLAEKHDVVRVEPSMRNRGDGRVRLLSTAISKSEAQPSNSFLIGEQIRIEFSVESLTAEPVSFWLIVFDATGRPLLSAHQRDVELVSIEKGRYRVVFETAALGLMPGNYTLSAGAFDRALTFLDWVDNCQSFEVLPSFHDGVAFDGRWGAMNLPGSWTVHVDGQ